MEKIMSKADNPLYADVYLNGHINIGKIPVAVLHALLAGLETEIAAYYEKKQKRQRRKKIKKDT